MSTWVKAALAAVAMAVALPGAAQAATCGDYATQADAQRAADTRDADSDGVYCESLPCPCLKPGGGGGSAPKVAPTPAPKRKPVQRISARITSVVDGDTIKVRATGGQRRSYTVRLIGIDTPETRKPGTPVECGGKRASERMLRLAFTAPADSDGDGVLDSEGGTGRKVTLRTDPTQDTTDRYGRLLAYVTTAGGTYVQSKMLSSGWATTYVYGGKPFQRVARHRAAQRQAKAAGRGVYGACGGNFHTPASSTSAAPLAHAARTATVYAGYSTRVGSLRTQGEKWMVSEGSSRVGEVRRQSSKWVVYEGSSRRVGEVRRQGSKWVVYQGYSRRVGEVRPSGSKWVVYEGYSGRVGEVRGAGTSGGGPAGGAALLLLL